jgi:hypothetical protein
MILTVLGWLAALACAAVAAPLAVRSLLNPQWRRDPGNWISVLMYSCLAVIGFTAAGLLSPLAGAVLGVALAGVLAAVARPWQEGRPLDLRLHAAFGKDWLAADALAIWDRMPGRDRGKPEKGSAPVVVAEATAARNIPNVMDDPALGPAPEPAELTSGAGPAPAPYLALAEFIASFEPEDDLSLRMFMEGSASGSILLADAWHHFADTCLNSVGLDPAYVAGILEAGDSSGAHGILLAQVHKRFAVIYAAVKEWVGAHGPLPHKARDFLTGDV